MSEENIDKIKVHTMIGDKNSTQPRCKTCEYADTHLIVDGTVHCMYTPGSPVAHSADHVCMQYKEGSNR